MRLSDHTPISRGFSIRWSRLRDGNGIGWNKGRLRVFSWHALPEFSAVNQFQRHSEAGNLFRYSRRASIPAVRARDMDGNAFFSFPCAGPNGAFPVHYGVTVWTKNPMAYAGAQAVFVDGVPEKVGDLEGVFGVLVHVSVVWWFT